MSAPTELFATNRIPIDTLKQITVGREYLLDRIHQSLCLAPDDRNSPCWLITGPRGMGKTHLLRLLFDRVMNDPRTKSQWVTLQLSEEEYWRSYSASTFLRSLLKQLLEKNQAVLQSSQDWPEVINTRKELEQMKSGEGMFAKARALLERVLRLLGQRLVIGLENFDSLFYQFKDKELEAHRLREFLQHTPRISVVATAITTDLGSDISQRQNPFYQFFRLEKITRLDFEQQRQQLYRIAAYDIAQEDQARGHRVQRFLRERRRRHALEVVHRLSGGNPRLGVVLYGVLGGADTLMESLDLLHELLDQSTPYFQDRMKDLAPLERTLAAAFCEAPTTLTAAQAAVIAGMEAAKANALITRMERSGFIERVDYQPPSRKAGRPYQVAEDLFRMWWQYRFDSDQIVRKIVHFLAYIYLPEELRQMHEDLLKMMQSGTGSVASIKRTLRYTETTIKFYESSDYIEIARSYGFLPEKLIALKGVTVPVAEAGMETEDILVKIKELERKAQSREVKPQDLFNLGQLYLEAEDSVKAEATLKRFLEIDSQNAPAWHYLGNAKAKQKDYDSAREAFQNSLDLDPTKSLVWFNFGMANNLLKDYQRALEAFKKGLELDPADAYGWGLLGAAKNNMGDYPGAQEALQKSLELNPDSAFGWHSLGIVYNNLSDYQRALEALNKGLELNPDSAQVWRYLGAVKNNLGDYPGAQEALQKSLELNPDSAFGWHSLGIVYNNLSDYQRALEVLNKYLELDPASAQGWLNLGIAKRNLNDFDGAREAFQKCLEIDKDNDEAWIQFGVMKGDQGDHLGALEAFYKSVEINPADAFGWLNLGNAKRNLNDFDGAREAFQKCLEIDKDNDAAWIKYGIMKGDQGDHLGALEAFHKSVEINPANAQGWLNLSLAKIMLNDNQGALEAAQMFVELEPQEAKALYNLSRIKFKSKDYEGALKALQKSVDLDPTEADAWLNLGRIKVILEDYQGAKGDLEKGLSLDSSSSETFYLLGLINTILGDESGAVASLDTAMNLNPQDINIWGTIISIFAHFGDTVRVKKGQQQLRQQNPASLITPAVQFTLAARGVLQPEEVAKEFMQEASSYSASDSRWPELLTAISDALLTGVDVKSAAKVQARKKLAAQLAGLRLKPDLLSALEDLDFVFDYFLARLDPAALKIPGGKKMTPKQRGEYALARVPHEQRQAIKDLIERVKTNAKVTNKKQKLENRSTEALLGSEPRE